MKKRIIIICLCAICCILFCSCKTSDFIEVNLSEKRVNLFIAENNDFYATFMSGTREDPYQADGISCKKVNFGIVAVGILKQYSSEIIDFVLTVNNVSYSGQLEFNPNTFTYMTDIGVAVQNDDVLTILIKDLNENLYNFNCLSKNWEINYANAIEIASKKLSSVINEYKKYNSPEIEFYLKIISNSHSTTKVYFWHFSYQTQDNNTGSVLISVNTGEILAIS